MAMPDTPSTPRRLATRAKVAWTYARWVAVLRARRRRVLVLRYHALGRPEDVASYASPGISLTPGRFDAQIGFLVRHYDVIDLPEALARVRDGVPAPRPGIVITFDDGYRDNFDHALPILESHGATATFYVVAGSVWPAPPIWTVRLRHVLTGPGSASLRGREPGGIDVSDEAARQRAVRALTRTLRALPERER